MNGSFAGSTGGSFDRALPMMRAEQGWIRSHRTQESIHYLRDLPTNLKLKEEGLSFMTFSCHTR